MEKLTTCAALIYVARIRVTDGTRSN